MTILAQSATAKADGTAVVSISPTKSGVQWAIGQIAVESAQASQTAEATVRVNGRLYTSAQFLPMTASGQPALMLQAADIMTVEFTNLTPGDTAEVSCWYNESPWGEIPRVDVM
jgi:hypothetical protein